MMHFCTTISVLSWTATDPPLVRVCCVADNAEEPVHQLYAEILKRLDDSNDTVRKAACQTFSTFLRAAPKEHFKGTIIDYTLDCLFVHLDDADPSIQVSLLRSDQYDSRFQYLPSSLFSSRTLCLM